LPKGPPMSAFDPKRTFGPLRKMTLEPHSAGWKSLL
jgi:hypothetical protein